MDQIIFLLIVGGISLINSIFREGGLKDTWLGENEPRKRTESPPRGKSGSDHSRSGGNEWYAPRVEDTEQERVRKFMDALGLPTTDAPPPPVPLQPQVKTQVVPPDEGTTRRQTPPRRAIPARTFKPKVVSGQTALPSQPQADAYADKKHEIRPEPILTKQEREALKRIEQEETQDRHYAHTDARQAYQVKSRRKSSAVSGLHEMLTGSGSLKTAFVLKEILDQPRGLQALPGPTTWE